MDCREGECCTNGDPVQIKALRNATLESVKELEPHKFDEMISGAINVYEVLEANRELFIDAYEKHIGADKEVSPALEDLYARSKAGLPMMMRKQGG